VLLWLGRWPKTARVLVTVGVLLLVLVGATGDAALSNLDENAVDNVTLVRLSAEELTEALNEVRPSVACTAST
jgi:tRNA (uracil-5-)-methyltransferase